MVDGGGKKCGIAALLVMAAAFLVYLTALKNGFVNFDDPAYVSENPMLAAPFAKLIGWAFTSVVAANWHPLTLLSHALDFRLFGLNPLGHHLVNNILHALNTFLVFLLMLRLVATAGGKEEAASGENKRIWIAGTAALLFAVHPLHVESVAWISERKDLLSAFFYLLSVFCYLGYAGREWQRERGVSIGSARLYVLSLFFCLLALLAKPMAVSLPIVLLLIDYYPLMRFGEAKRVIAEKIPFFALSVAVSIATLFAQFVGGAVRGAEFALVTRVLVAVRAYAFYLYKTVFPAKLTPFYPYPEGVSIASPEFAASVALFIGISAFVVYFGKKGAAWLPALWLYYVVTLLPVVGLVQVGSQAAADRYMYLPSIAPLLLLGLLAGEAYERVRLRGLRKEVLILGIVIAAALGFLTIKQTWVWRDSVTLWSFVIDRYPSEVAGPYYNRGREYMKLEEYRKAEADFTKALELNPTKRGSLGILINRGIVYRKTGRLGHAIADFNRAIDLDPTDPTAYNNRGVAYGSMGDISGGIRDFERAVELDPAFTSAYRNLARAYSMKGDKSKAAYYMQKAGGGGE